MKVLIAFALCLVTSSAFTKFEKCKNLSSDQCFKTVLQEIKMVVGKDRSNDMFTMKVCGDFKKNDCCSTIPLVARKSVERWGPSSFGACKDKEFLIKSSLNFTIIKTGKDGIVIRNITLTTKPKDPKKSTEVESFLCGPTSLGTTPVRPTSTSKKICQPAAKFHVINAASFAMGPGKEDGTDDNVNVKICSDVTKECCSRKLSSLLSNDWEEKKVEKWSQSDFGDCSKIFYKIKKFPQITISKSGRDTLRLLNVTLDMDIRDKNWDKAPKRLRTICTDRNLHLNADCKKTPTNKLCNYTFKTCRTQKLKVDPKSRKTIETPKRPAFQSILTTTTLKPKKKGGILGKLFGR